MWLSSGILLFDLELCDVPVFNRNAEPEAAFDDLPTPSPIPEKRNYNRALTVILGALCLVLASLLIVSNLANRQSAQTRVLARQPRLVLASIHAPCGRAAHHGDSPQTLASGQEIPKASLPTFRHTIHFLELKCFIFVPTLTDFTPVGRPWDWSTCAKCSPPSARNAASNNLVW